MAVRADKAAVTLRLQLENGVDDNGNPKFANKSFNKIKVDATDEGLHAAGTILGGLYRTEVSSIKKVEESILVNE